MQISSAKGLACGFALLLYAGTTSAATPSTPMNIDFNDRNDIAQIGFVTFQDPPLTIGNATFSGGALVGSAVITVNPTIMYSTDAPDHPCNPPEPFCYVPGCNTCAPTVTVTFAQPVNDVTFDLYGTLPALPSGFRVTDDLGHVLDFTLPPANEGGMTTVSLPYPQIGRVEIAHTTTTINGGWRIAVDNFRSGISFDLKMGTEEKALIHRYDATDSGYPTRFQAADRTVKIEGNLHGAPTTVGGRTIYLRVVDPPDRSVYVPTAASQPDDNVEPANAYPRIPSTVTTDGAGRFSTNLLITDRYAGDNYQVEASIDPQLVSDPNYECGEGCYRSGTVTAWKRVYVERDRMFRAGTFLTQDVTPCAGTGCPATTILHVANARDVAHARRLRLLHAPRFDGAGPASFYFEDIDVVRVNRNQNTVEISNPTRAYFGPDTDLGGVTRVPALADAVGMITGPDVPGDYYEANTAYVDPLFASSFVEYVWLSDDPVPYVPYRENVLGFGAVNDELSLLARKWFHRYGDSNVRHLVGAHAASDAVTLGRTAAGIGTNFIWVFVQSVIDNAPHSGETRFNGEVTAHEFAHAWNVNLGGSGGGHCSERQYNNSSRWCTMHGSYDDSGACHGTCPEFYDGIVAFHYVAGDSEYLHIRQRPEPLP